MLANIKEAFGVLVKGFNSMSNAQLVKAAVVGGIVIGVAVCSAWVLIRHIKKMHEEANAEMSYERSPIDDILGVNYVGDTDVYEDMDPEAQRICRKLNKSWNKNQRKNRTAKKMKSKKAKKVGKKTVKKIRDAMKRDENTVVVSLFDGPSPLIFDEDDEDSYMEELAKAMSPAHRKDHIGKGKKKSKIIDPEHMSRIAAICMQWGEPDADEDAIHEQMNEIADELGMDIEELEEAISKTIGG